MSYWSLRYLVILFIGCAVIASVSIYWIRETARDNRLQTSSLFVQDLADRVSGPSGLEIPPQLDELVENRLRFFRLDPEFCLLILDQDGKLVYSMPKITEQQMEEKWDPQALKSRHSEYASVSAAVKSDSAEAGRVVLLQSDKSLTTSRSVLVVVVILLITFTLSGWLTIYLLSSRLSKPLKQITIAAGRIRSGNYNIENLQLKTQEREISELVGSFREMALRLKQLEDWRMLSLAGVSHELKTPVTSIKGLLHAVKDKVVDEEEAEEFLELALQETGRLDRMVADLLEYNALAAGNVSVRSDRIELNALLTEVVRQWELMEEHRTVSVSLELPSDQVYGIGDSLRIRQILVNLLNNSFQAAHPDRPLFIRVSLDAGAEAEAEAGVGAVAGAGEKVRIEVQDNGIGVSQEDQPNIFERFYRGERRSARPRGLGLGLTYSRLLAQALGGELELLVSSNEGSLFALTLNRA
ncbi:HAMP domain-containing sensor histidine kinase [Paenibacillus pinistramenti]|uniref:HAMP domain-containing sensor histidine kinase n=1 Tax=Paenibacillus pinistramenti TaxID=1768003 RepID=UPI001396827F|nr:HAMP domain-containing sensor histidine kinase [Paenibacillus pinistramenti]